ncbi:MAG: L-2-hydroxyglutarate oxidase [Saprospiraceae bacterium]
MDSKFDVIIVGAGIVGLATAYFLTKERPGLKLAILEKEAAIGQHQTGHNSGVIHSGIYYTPGSLKAKNCRRGYHQLLEFCETHGIEYELCGKVIVATNEAERPQLDLILEKGLANGLKKIKKISREETLEIEPNVNVVEAIKVPEAGIVDYLEVAKMYAKLITAAGGQILTKHKLLEVKLGTPHHQILTNQGDFQTKMIINCAGLYADKLAQMTGQHLDFKILPFRGEYYELVKEKEHLVNHLIYPVPNPNFPFLGVHFTRMIKGGIEAGPNAVLAFRREGYSRWDINFPELFETLGYAGFQKLAMKYWKDGLGELYRSYSKAAFVKALQHLIPSVQNKDLFRGNAGVRAQACQADGSLINDFLILESPGVINVCNAPSPAATSSISIGETIGQKLLLHWDKL